MGFGAGTAVPCPYDARRARSGQAEACRYVGLIGVGFEEDENYYAGDGDVEPDGEGPAGDTAVHGEAAGQREEEGGEHHRQSDHGKDYVAG